MKKLNLFLQIIFALSLSTFFLTSCQDDEVTDIPQEEIKIPDGEALGNKFSENVKNALQNFSLDASEGGSVTGEKGTVLWFSGNSLVDADGDSVKGDVNIELIEVFDKTTMLLYGKSTMA